MECPLRPIAAPFLVPADVIMFHTSRNSPGFSAWRLFTLFGFGQYKWNHFLIDLFHRGNRTSKFYFCESRVSRV
jgi:hypothetical protein